MWNVFFESQTENLTEHASKNMHLSYLGFMKENNMFLTPTAPNDIKVLIDIVKVNKGVGPKSIPTKILKDYKSEFSKHLSDISILILQQAYSPVPFVCYFT